MSVPVASLALPDDRAGHQMAAPVGIHFLDPGGECVMHRVHEPVSLVNQLHHLVREADQMAAWGKIQVPLLYAVCPTGHDNVHYAGIPTLAGTTDRYVGHLSHATLVFSRAALDARDAIAAGNTPDVIYRSFRDRMAAEGFIDYDTARGHPR